MTSWWEGAAKLLSAGPLGLGAIIVLVTGTILLSGKAIEKGRQKVSLSLLGAGCILVLAGFGVLVLQTNAAAAAADAAARLAVAKAQTQHQLYFRIEPLDSEKTFDAPDIIINNDRLTTKSYTVQSDITVIIDVSKALHQAGEVIAHASSSSDKALPSKKVREQLAADIDTSIAQIQRVKQLMSQSCPGGAHGQDPFHYGDLVNLTDSIASSLQKYKSVLLAFE
jgi:transcriptional regulator of acetoin/glycerol metabolism